MRSLILIFYSSIKKPRWTTLVPDTYKNSMYDLWVIQNEEEFRRDIENVGNVKVIIVKH